MKIKPQTAPSCLWPSRSDYDYLILLSPYASPKVLLLLRAFNFIASLLPLFIVLSLDPPDFIFYFTDWGSIMTSLYFWYILMYSLLRYLPRISRTFHFLSCVFTWKGSTILYELAFTSQFGIFLCYWISSFFYKVQRNTKQEVSTCIIHSVPFALMILECFNNSIRGLKMHFLVLQIVFAAYAAVNFIYVKSGIGKSFIYPFVTWDNWQTVLAMALFEGVLFTGFILSYLIGEYKYGLLAKKGKLRSFSESSTDDSGLEAPIIRIEYAGTM